MENDWVEIDNINAYYFIVLRVILLQRIFDGRTQLKQIKRVRMCRGAQEFT